MELFLLLAIFGFMGAGKLLKSHPQTTHIVMIVLGVTFGIGSLLGESGLMIAFFVLVFGLYTCIYALHDTVGSDYFPTLPTLFILLIGAAYLCLAALFHNVGTFFLATITMLYWIRELMRLPRGSALKS